MPNYETELDTAGQQEMIRDILQKFRLVTGVPIALFDNTLAAENVVVHDEQIAYGTVLPYLQQCVKEKQALEFAVADGQLTVVPIQTSSGTFGYLCALAAGDRPAEYYAGLRKFLEYAADDIARNCLNMLMYRHYVEEFKRSIWDNLDKDLSVGLICEVMGIGKTTLSANFKKYAGTSIAKFILNTRIEKAQLLLANTDIPITEISAQVGFTDYNYFCRVFRKVVGESPSSFRTLHRVS